MFNSSVLDVAAGVAFVFLLVSTICASVREGIEHLLKTRAAFLEFAVRELLRDREGQALARALYDHPLVSALYPGDYVARAGDRPTLWPPARGLPSYIPSRTFAMALLDLAARGPTGDGEPDLVESTYASVRQSVATMQNPSVQRVLLLALDASQGNLERARQYLEAWYDGAMDRVSGWYKRATQGIIFAIALVVAVVGNIDAIEIASRLYRDPAVRELVVAAAEKTQQAGKVEDAQATLEGLGVPLGWWWTSPPKGYVLEWIGDWLASIPSLVIPHALGWLLTAFAATLGAPFWFDILNKVMVIRSTVKPHEKSPEEASEDRQAKAQPAPQPQPNIVVQPPLVMQPADNDQHEHDHDSCGDPITHVTRDEDLPPARGGVG